MKSTYQIIAFINEGRKEYFFSNDYCQKGPRDNGFVEVAFYMPHELGYKHPTLGVEVQTKDDLIVAYFSGYTEIENPDPTKAHGKWTIADTASTYEDREGNSRYHTVYYAVTQDEAQAWLDKRPPDKLQRGDYEICGPNPED